MKIKDVIEFVTVTIPLRFYANDFPIGDESDCGFIRIEPSQPDSYIIGMKETGFQIVVRHRKGGESERIAGEIWGMFHGRQHFEIGNSEVKFAKCNQSEPIYIGVDKNKRTIYSVNVTCKILE